MNTKPLSRYALAFAASFAAGCLSGPEKEPVREVGALYSCIGEPGYPENAVKELIAELEANPPVCPETVSSSPIILSVAAPDTAVDSMEVHLVVLDEQCDLVQESRWTSADIRSGSASRIMIDGLDDNGNRLPSGEYYVNVEITRATEKDTSYAKIGLIRDLCAP